MTIQPLAEAYTAEGFNAYLASRVTRELAMRAWRPRGVVLHNTGFLAGPYPVSTKNFYIDMAHGDRPLDGAQRVRNMWQSYIRKGWPGGPHLVLTDREIYTANPLWLPGTHSPSWNATFWGLEMAGDYDIEPFSPELRRLAVEAMAGLYSLLGHEPENETFHLHKEDMLSSHRHCPGRHAGLKAQWIADIDAAMAQMHPGDHEPEPPPEAGEEIS
jgi:hypothetical protein